MPRKKKTTKKDINIVDLSKEREKVEEEQNKTPELVVEKFEALLQKAKEGTLNVAIVHFAYDAKDEEDEVGGTLLWHKDNNLLEVLGLIEVIRNVAMQGIGEEGY